jgi:hypothetical protein
MHADTNYYPENEEIPENFSDWKNPVCAYRL